MDDHIKYYEELMHNYLLRILKCYLIRIIILFFVLNHYLLHPLLLFLIYLTISLFQVTLNFNLFLLITFFILETYVLDSD